MCVSQRPQGQNTQSNCNCPGGRGVRLLGRLLWPTARRPAAPRWCARKGWLAPTRTRTVSSKGSDSRDPLFVEEHFDQLPEANFLGKVERAENSDV